jgi:hypothetical protein
MFNAKHLMRLLLAAAVTFEAQAAIVDGAPDANKLLEQSDLARGGGLKGVQLSSSVTEIRDGRPGSELKLEIQAAATDSLISFTEPPRVRGNRMLMQGRNLWFASPDVRKPVAISPRQRMLGEASNGDIATTNYSRDYDAALVGEGTVDGHPVWVLDLKAKAAAVTYDRIRYYIDKEAALGIKAEYFAVSGNVLKTARIEYDNHVRHNGQTVRFVSRMEIADALEPSKRTVLKYWDVKVNDISSATLSLANLTRN